jgi:hypothetical protein
MCATWSGARAVFKHPRVPLFFLGFRCLSRVTGLLAIVLGFVFQDFIYFFLCPKSNPKSSDRLHGRDVKLLFSYPPVQRVWADSHKFRNLNRRAALRLYHRIGLSDLSSRTILRTGLVEEYLSFGLNGKRSGDLFGRMNLWKRRPEIRDCAQGYWD